MAVSNRTAKRKMVAKEREAEAIDLRRRGASYSEIAERIGTCISAAYKIVRKHMDRLAAQASEDATEIRALEIARLDGMLRGLWPRAADGDVNAVDRVLKIMERRAKLLGLDAPAKVAPTAPDGATPYQPGQMNDAQLLEGVLAIVAQGDEGAIAALIGGAFPGQGLRGLAAGGIADLRVGVEAFTGDPSVIKGEP